MARCLLEVGVRPETFTKLMQTPEDRAKATRPVLEVFGGSLDEHCLVVGQAIVHLVGETPDEITIEAMTIAVLAGGAETSIKFAPILAAAEAMVAMQRAGDAMHRSPSTE